jgi:hypothetical protein
MSANSHLSLQSSQSPNIFGITIKNINNKVKRQFLLTVLSIKKSILLTRNSWIINPSFLLANILILNYLNYDK